MNIYSYIAGETHIDYYSIQNSTPSFFFFDVLRCKTHNFLLFLKFNSIIVVNNSIIVKIRHMETVRTFGLMHHAPQSKSWPY